MIVVIVFLLFLKGETPEGVSPVRVLMSGTAQG
jgi:hypothetical protein